MKFLFTKKVDKSLLYEGMSIPGKYQEKLLQNMLMHLEYGETKKISIKIDDALYEATIVNQKYDKEKYPSHVPLIKILYGKNNKLKQKLKSIFITSDFYLKNLKKENKKYITIPEDKREYVDIFILDKQDILEFKPKTFSEDVFISQLDDDSLENIARSHSENKVKHTIIIETEKVCRDQYIAAYAKRLAKGVCQLCKKEAPFKNRQGEPYLEAHHIKWLSEGGEDTIENVVALCPNCHRKMHVLNEAEDVRILKEINSFDAVAERRNN